MCQMANSEGSSASRCSSWTIGVISRGDAVLSPVPLSAVFTPAELLASQSCRRRLGLLSLRWTSNSCRRDRDMQRQTWKCLQLRRCQAHRSWESVWVQKSAVLSFKRHQKEKNRGIYQHSSKQMSHFISCAMRLLETFVVRQRGWRKRVRFRCLHRLLDQPEAAR